MYGGDGLMVEDLDELRDVIIYCDGSMDVFGGLLSDIVRDVLVLGDCVMVFVMECVMELLVKMLVYVVLVGLINAEAREFGA